ncbi:adenylate kinase 8 isoform X2 [Paramormyrops kingsleyae]|uniref:adenylate kinase 8 isoform X2 n=1 Tax=Paramormyrops kingsleyae TaxID=1676925 RepID=UPI000CD61CBE|nr:adenylate kinase 8 isoform X2 [Paramormyrops kingsleyae]
MDPTANTLRIPPEMLLYAEKHEIFDLMQSMLRNLIVDKPEDPIQYLITLLKRDSIGALTCKVQCQKQRACAQVQLSLSVPRIMLLGPPASGKRTTARQLCERTRAVHITEPGVLEGEGELAREAKWHADRLQEIPCELWVKLIQQRLSKLDCIRQGWVLEGIPHSRQEALLLQELGISPHHVVMLEAPDEILIRRRQCRRVSVCSEDEKRVLSDDNTATRLLKYHQEVSALQRTFQNCLKIIKADQSHEDVFAQALSYIQRRPRPPAPYTPRVLLFGPPGSGKRLQAELISQKYNLVNICCGELLKAVSADKTSMGELIKPYLASGEQVPNDLVLQILTQRLSRMDCAARGWVLRGFPRNIEQAEMLKESNFIPNRVFFLEMPDDAVKEVVTLRAVDHVTGERYHSLFKPPPGPEVQARLCQNPRDSQARLLNRLSCYSVQVPALKAMYPDAVHVNADQDPRAIFETLESRLVERLPKCYSVLPSTQEPGSGEKAGE